MRKAAWFCGALSLAVFLSYYLLPKSALLPAAALCALLSAVLPRLGRVERRFRLRAHLALAGAAVGLLCFFAQEQFAAAPSDALAGESAPFQRA